MAGLKGKIYTADVALAASATTAEQRLNLGTLVGVSIPELTSTSFTITNSPTAGGTFRTVRDPFGSFGAADADVTASIGTTSVGYYPIPPALSAGLNYFKLVFSSSETATITLFYRSVD